jgi:hypothetical protein
MKIKKTLCCLDRDEIKDNIDELSELCSSPKYICRKCARVSGKEKHLCKPVRIKAKK